MSLLFIKEIVMRFTWENVRGRENTSTVDINEKESVVKYGYNCPAPGFQQGWICPKCGRVNAPWIGTCPCYVENSKRATFSN